MNNHDSSGREYARVAETRIGDTLIADGGFSCLKKGTRRVVQHGRQIACSMGWHVLDGQISKDGTHYVGFYPGESSRQGWIQYHSSG